MQVHRVRNAKSRHQGCSDSNGVLRVLLQTVLNQLWFGEKKNLDSDISSRGPRKKQHVSVNKEENHQELEQLRLKYFVYSTLKLNYSFPYLEKICRGSVGRALLSSARPPAPLLIQQLNVGGQLAPLQFP